MESESQNCHTFLKSIQNRPCFCMDHCRYYSFLQAISSVTNLSLFSVCSKFRNVQLVSHWWIIIRPNVLIWLVELCSEVVTLFAHTQASSITCPCVLLFSSVSTRLPLRTFWGNRLAKFLQVWLYCPSDVTNDHRVTSTMEVVFPIGKWDISWVLFVCKWLSVCLVSLLHLPTSPDFAFNTVITSIECTSCDARTVKRHALKHVLKVASFSWICSYIPVHSDTLQHLAKQSVYTVETRL